MIMYNVESTLRLVQSEFERLHRRTAIECFTLHRELLLQEGGAGESAPLVSSARQVGLHPFIIEPHHPR